MPAKDFQILNRLGEGSYSSVYKVKRLSDGKEYAMKKVKMGELNQKEIQNSLNEVRILASIRSPHVIRYKEAFLVDDSTTLCIIMEFAAGGDLLNLIQQRIKTRTSFTEREIWVAFIQITKALKVLHDHQILHRDLKCANVLLGQDGTAKLGDLNVSKHAKNNLAYTQAGTPYYASPEIWSDRPYDAKSDIWSLGCVFYEMAAQKPPFMAENIKELHKKIVRGTCARIPSQYSADLSNVLTWCLQKSPSQRPSCDQLLKSPIVAKYLKYDLMGHTPEKSSLDLLNTIKIPRNMKALSDQLPKANYAEYIDTNDSIGDKSTERSTFSAERRCNSANQKGKGSPAVKNGYQDIQSGRINNRKVPIDSRLPPLAKNIGKPGVQNLKKNPSKDVMFEKPVFDPSHNIHRKLVDYFGSDVNEIHIPEFRALMPKYKVVVAPEKNPYNLHHAQMNSAQPQKPGSRGLRPSSAASRNKVVDISSPSVIKNINGVILKHGVLNSPASNINGQIRHRNDSSAIASLIGNYDQVGDTRQQLQQANNFKVRKFQPILWA